MRAFCSRLFSNDMPAVWAIWFHTFCTGAAPQNRPISVCSALRVGLLFWPRGAEKLYGFTPKEALGILSHDLFHTQFPEPLGVLEKRLFETGMWEGELIHRKRDHIA